MMNQKLALWDNNSDWGDLLLSSTNLQQTTPGDLRAKFNLLHIIFFSKFKTQNIIACVLILSSKITEGCLIWFYLSGLRWSYCKKINKMTPKTVRIFRTLFANWLLIRFSDSFCYNLRTASLNLLTRYN